jgi:hypothetical protein
MCLGCIVDLGKELSKDRRALQDEDPMGFLFDNFQRGEEFN